MSQPATAAIVVGSLVGGVVFLFTSYKVYTKVFYARQRKQLALPPIREPQDYASQYLTPSTNAMAGTLYGDSTLRDSWRGSGSQSKASFYSHMDRAYGSETSYPSTNPRRSSSQGLLLQSTSPSGIINSDFPSPNSPSSVEADLSSGMPLPLTPSHLEAYGPIRHPKTLSSSSSTMTIKRSHASSIKSGGGMPSFHPPTYRRDTYLPHLPENRDQIQIVPPQPLGFGLGGMATALDQKTLAFSTTSGIGSGEDDFSRGLVWQEGNPDSAAQQQRASKLGEDERLRYLAQGPRALSPSIRGAVHNHIYAGSNAGSSGMRTPDVPSSRSRSPAHIAHWDASSSSDVGPSVSQRGAGSPSQLPSQIFSHPLEASNSIHSNYSQNARNAALTNQQSPLAMMSGAIGEGMRPLGTPSPQKGSTSTSPILGAFRNPPNHHHHQVVDASRPDFASHSHSNSQNSGSASSGYIGERTPGLLSESVSTEHGSGSVPMTDSSGRQSAVDPRIGGADNIHVVDMHGKTTSQGYAMDEEKRITIGKNGQLQVIGSGDDHSVPGIDPSEVAKDDIQNNGWRISRLFGGRT